MRPSTSEANECGLFFVIVTDLPLAAKAPRRPPHGGTPAKRLKLWRTDVTPAERHCRFLGVSKELAEIAKHKIVDLVSDREGKLLEELDELEYQEGLEYFQRRLS